MDGTPVGRRVFLGLAAFGVSGILWGSKAAGFMERLLAPVAAKDGSGILGLLPIGRFRIYSIIGTLPSRATADWHLTVDGLAGAPYTIGWDELLALPPVELTKDFQCVTGWRVLQVKWEGGRARAFRPHRAVAALGQRHAGRRAGGHRRRPLLG